MAIGDFDGTTLTRRQLKVATIAVHEIWPPYTAANLRRATGGLTLLQLYLDGECDLIASFSPSVASPLPTSFDVHASHPMRPAPGTQPPAPPASSPPSCPARPSRVALPLPAPAPFACSCPHPATRFRLGCPGQPLRGRPSRRQLLNPRPSIRRRRLGVPVRLPQHLRQHLRRVPSPAPPPRHVPSLRTAQHRAQPAFPLSRLAWPPRGRPTGPHPLSRPLGRPHAAHPRAVKDLPVPHRIHAL